MDILVISGCSGDKQFDEVPIGCEELDSTSRNDVLETYPDYVAPAAEMYTGDEQKYPLAEYAQRILRGVDG